MLIYLFTQYYPSTYKPYFDTQFAQLVRDGHEIVIFAHGRQGVVVNETVTRFDLARRARYYPTTLHTLPAAMPGGLRRVARSPGGALRRVRALAGAANWKDRLTNTVRALSLPRRKPDLCLIHDLTTATWFRMLGKVYPGVPLAMYYHGGETATSSKLREVSSREAFLAADVVFTNTAFSRDHAISRGCPAERIRVVPVGFCLDDYVPPTVRTYRADGLLRILTAGRMSEEKGHRYGLEAICQLVEGGITDLHYSIVGSGYLRPELEAFVDKHNLRPYVEFTGLVTTAELIRRIAAADVVLLPSIQVGNWIENQACIVQEAMLMKTPVIATITGGVPESIAPELRCFMPPPGDSGAIARAILAIRDLDTAELRRLGEMGRAFAESRYDIRELNREILTEILAVPGKAAAGAMAPIPKTRSGDRTC